MSIHNFIGLAFDISGIHVKIYDCTRQVFVFEKSNDILEEIDVHGLGEYEIVGYDLYKNMDNECYLELSIEM